jgi:hypothetical protein
VEGNHWMIDTGSSKAEADRILEIIKHYHLASMCFVGRPRCGDVRPMMYWLTDAGVAPSGNLAGEDCIRFDPDHLAVIEVGGRWKVAEGAHWLLDFGPGHGNAVAALHFIRKYRFNEMCFVGRPDPSMTYFKRRRGALGRFEFMDPRLLEATVDPPVWWRHQRDSVARIETIIDLSAHPAGDCKDPLAEAGIRLEAIGKTKGAPRIIEQSGIRGLALRGKYELHLRTAVEQVDVLIAHFGRPPTLAATCKGKEKVTAVGAERPRQVELLRLLGSGLNRISIEAPDDTILVQLSFPGHTRDGKAGASAKLKRKKG